jgi:polysaccharide export outer membrane protein
MKRWIALLGLAVPAWAQTIGPPAPTPTPTPAAPVVADGSAYVIGPKDLVEIRVLEIPELNVERRVSDDGSIALPLLGDLAASGLTANQLREKLEAVLKERYVHRANVSVVVKEFADKPVSVLGAVRTPGALRVSGKFTLLQAISAAGGLTAEAGRKVYVLRPGAAENSRSTEIDVESLFRGDPAANVLIYPSDIINVPLRKSVRVFCLGEIKNPGAYDFDGEQRVTLLAVIARAGGLTDRASKTIRIRRRLADGQETQLEVHYGRVLSGKDPDPLLQAEDIVVVKESFL